MAVLARPRKGGKWIQAEMLSQLPCNLNIGRPPSVHGLDIGRLVRSSPYDGSHRCRLTSYSSVERIRPESGCDRKYSG